MLKVLRAKSKIIIIITAVLFILGMALMGLGSLSGMFGKKNYIGKIGKERIKINDFNSAFQNMVNNYSNQTQNKDLSKNILAELNNQTWFQLVQKNIFAKAAKDYKIKITDDEVADSLKNNPPEFIKNAPAFQTDSVFDKEKYLNNLVNNPNLSFLENVVRENLIFQKLKDYILKDLIISDDQVRELFMDKNNKASGKIIVFSTDLIKEKIKVPEKEVYDFYEKNKAQFQKPETRIIKYLAFTGNPPEGKEQDASNKINKIYKLALSGKDFAALAKQYSEDKSADNGGNLGYFSKNQLLKEFSIVFSLKKNQISKPIKTNFGWHILKVSDIRTNDAGEKEVKISQILVKEEVDLQKALDKAKEFLAEAEKIGFDSACSKNALTPQKSIDLMKNYPYVQIPVKNSQIVHDFVFSSQINQLSPVYEGENGYYVVCVDNIDISPYYSFDKVKSYLETQLEDNKKMEKLQFVVDSFLRTNSPNYLKAAKKMKYKIVDFEDLSVNSTLPLGINIKENKENFVDAILSTSEKKYAEIFKDPKAYYLAYVDKKAKIDFDDFKKNKEKLKSELRESKEYELLNNWYRDQIQRTTIEDYRSQFYDYLNN